jgi:hypothetical protein
MEFLERVSEVKKRCEVAQEMQKRPEESIGEIFSRISHRNQKLQYFEVDAQLLQMGELQIANVNSL